MVEWEWISCRGMYTPCWCFFYEFTPDGIQCAHHYYCLSLVDFQVHGYTSSLAGLPDRSLSDNSSLRGRHCDALFTIFQLGFNIYRRSGLASHHIVSFLRCLFHWLFIPHVFPGKFYFHVHLFCVLSNLFWSALWNVSPRRLALVMLCRVLAQLWLVIISNKLLLSSWNKILIQQCVCYDVCIGTLLSVARRGRFSRTNSKLCTDAPLWYWLHDRSSILHWCSLFGISTDVHDGLRVGTTQRRCQNEFSWFLHIQWWVIRSCIRTFIASCIDLQYLVVLSVSIVEQYCWTNPSNRFHFET